MGWLLKEQVGAEDNGRCLSVILLVLKINNVIRFHQLILLVKCEGFLLDDLFI